MSEETKQPEIQKNFSISFRPTPYMPLDGRPYIPCVVMTITEQDGTVREYRSTSNCFKWIGGSAIATAAESEAHMAWLTFTRQHSQNPPNIEHECVLVHEIIEIEKCQAIQNDHPLVVHMDEEGPAPPPGFPDRPRDPNVN